MIKKKAASRIRLPASITMTDFLSAKRMKYTVITRKLEISTFTINSRTEIWK